MGSLPDWHAMLIVDMTYYADLSEYSYDADSGPALNVGWLDKEHTYPTGDLPADLRDKLLAVTVLSPVNQTRGFHQCELCDRPAYPPIDVRWRDRTRAIGSAEVRVTAEDGTVYACPDLLIHYVDAHRYYPPDAFVEALRSMRVEPRD